jgi:hypothetical protein
MERSFRKRKTIEGASSVALMSIIVITPDSYGTVHRLMDCLLAQTIRQELELILVIPAGASDFPGKLLIDNFAAIKKVEISSMGSTAQVRVEGIREATCPIITFTEEHCLPEPDWAEALLEAHRNGWSVIGPAVTNGNPDSLCSWANFLIEYSHWVAPAPAGIVNHLPGHNSSYKRDVLLSYGSTLSDRLESESLMHWDLHSKGHRLYLEPSVRVRHFNFSRIWPAISLRFLGGRLFGGMRRSGWSIVKCGIYAAGSFLIPAVRLIRIFKELFHPGRPRNLAFAVLPLMSFLLAIDAFGEMTGYLFGPGDAPKRIARMDFHRELFMNRRDRQQFAGSKNGST